MTNKVKNIRWFVKRKIDGSRIHEYNTLVHKAKNRWLTNSRKTLVHKAEYRWLLVLTSAARQTDDSLEFK